jgi:hypothetical protein
MLYVIPKLHPRHYKTSSLQNMTLPRRPPIFLFEEDGVCWSRGANMPLISRGIELCAHKVGPWITRESRAVTDRGPRYLSGALTGRTVDKNSGQLELTDWRWTVDREHEQGCYYTILIGIQDLRFRARTPSRPTWHSVKARRSQRAQYPNRRQRVSDVTGCKSSWIVKITSR